jgi:hypothetical protein
MSLLLLAADGKETLSESYVSGIAAVESGFDSRQRRYCCPHYLAHTVFSAVRTGIKRPGLEADICPVPGIMLGALPPLFQAFSWHCA